MIDDRRRPSVEVSNEGIRGINAKVMINRCEKVSWAAYAFNGIFTTFIRRANHATSLNTTAGPDI